MHFLPKLEVPPPDLGFPVENPPFFEGCLRYAWGTFMAMDILILVFSGLPGRWQFSEVLVMAINLVAMVHTSWLMVLHAACSSFRAPMCMS